MYLVSFGIIHSFGPQIVYILRINFIIISLLHVLSAVFRATAFSSGNKRLCWLVFHMNIDLIYLGSGHQCPVNYHWITISVHLCSRSKHRRMPAPETMQPLRSRKWVRSKLRRSILYRLWIFAGCLWEIFSFLKKKKSKASFQSSTLHH